jgi:hypothetical protein
MTLPVSGAISFNAINVELGVSGTTQASLGQSSYRTLAGVASGAISMSNFYGKANQFTLTISTNQTNANLRTLAINAGWNGTTSVVATINSGVYVSSNSTGTPGLTISGSFPNGVTLTNNGYIVGMGGAGGTGGSVVNTNPGVATAGANGGLALSVASAVSITNNGTIGGGGGGGGGGGPLNENSGKDFGYGGGGGGGGGRTGATNSSGGSGGTASGGQKNVAGAAGSSGTSASGGSGGLGGLVYSLRGGTGGSGGTWGATGGTGASTAAYPGRGRGGGSGGGAVSGNSNISWVATGTRLGAIT